MVRIGIFYHSDPVGSVPSGIDSFIRGILEWAPADLVYSLYGATAAPDERPVGRASTIVLGTREVRYFPLVSLSPTGQRSRLPLTVRYLYGLRRVLRVGGCRALDILDFHRIESVALFRNDTRPKNLVLHQDMSVLREANSDIKWRHAPWAYEALERRLFHRIDRVYCVRESAVERYRAQYPGLRERFRFIPTWFDPRIFAPPANAEVRAALRFAVRRSLDLSPSTRLLVFVGRLDRQKDPALLIEAFGRVVQRAPDVHLLVVGDGPLRSSLERRVQDDNLQRAVTFVGVRSRSDIADLLRAGDLFVLSSAYEGMPIAVLEALATGLPVVSTDVGEIRRVLREGINGCISRDFTPEALAEAMRTALAGTDTMSGPPCLYSVAPFRPDTVLGPFYDNHREQACHRVR